MNKSRKILDLENQIDKLTGELEATKAEMLRDKPHDRLLGRWANHLYYGYVLVVTDKVDDDECVYIVVPKLNAKSPSHPKQVNLIDLTFCEESAEPEMADTGSVWFANVDDSETSARKIAVTKTGRDCWRSRPVGVDAVSEWRDEDVTLITPLVSVKPWDVKTVSTVEDYLNLPGGSIVAASGAFPWTNFRLSWRNGEEAVQEDGLAGTPRQVLRWGWGE